MAILVKSVRWDGSGDYTTIADGVSGILGSGLAATGYYDEYVLTVDSGYYSGYFNAEVPFSGNLRIIGSGTWWAPTGTSTISGEFSLSKNTLDIYNFTINGPSGSEIFNIYQGASVSINDTTILDAYNVIVNSGYLTISNVSAHGVGPVSGGAFLRDYGTTLINDSSIAYFISGIYSNDITVSSSRLIGNSYGIVSNSGIVNISESLIYGGGSGIIIETPPTGYLYIDKSTIDGYKPIVTSGCIIQITESILYASNGTCIVGSVISGLAEDTIMYPSGTATAFTQINVRHSDPRFKHRTIGDYRLKFKQTVGSPAVEMKDMEIFHSSVDLYTEQAQFSVKDERGILRSAEFRPFVYRQGNTLLFSDYGKEIAFANTKSLFKDLNYRVEMMANFEASGVPVKPSFTLTTYNPFPYDWDYRKFETTEITDEHEYLIPRSIVDVADAISGYVGSWLNSVVFGKMDKRNITPYLYGNYRGVTYDYDLSLPGNAVLWMVEGNNQMLIKANAFTGEQLERYPLFVPEISGKPFIRASGLIFAGVEGDKYRYLLADDPNDEYLLDRSDGLMRWIATDLDTHKDARGILAYKNNLFITLTEYYPTSIFDRTVTPIYAGTVGKLIRYDNNNTFEHYIANYTTQTGPSGFLLYSGNAYPTDLTVYEDGRFLIADYNDRDTLFKYRLAYDYAILQSSYDEETRILLRENYENVEL